MVFLCWSSAVGGGSIVKQHWVESSRLLGSTQVSVYTHPSPTIIFSPADQGTFSKTAGQSQAYYNTWNWERGTYDVNHLHILTCEEAVSRLSSVYHRVKKYNSKLAVILDLSAKYWLDHFQNIKNGFLDPNYVRNKILMIFVGHIDEKIYSAPPLYCPRL